MVESFGERAPLSKKAFGGRLERHGFAADRGARGVAIRRGIGLRDQQRLGMTAAATADASAVGSELPI